MVDAFIGEIRIFAGKYVPVGWAECAGQVLRTAEYPALSALLGNTYGGDTTGFALPDLRCRLPVGIGQGTGLSISHALGAQVGQENITLTTAQYPAHTHSFNATSDPATSYGPSASTTTATNDMMLAAAPTTDFLYAVAGTSGATTMELNNTTIGSSPGASDPHTNVMPVLPMKYIICLNGIFPSQS